MRNNNQQQQQIFSSQMMPLDRKSLMLKKLMILKLSGTNQGEPSTVPPRCTTF